MPSSQDIKEISSDNAELKKSTADELKAANNQLRLDTDKRFADMEQLTKAILFVAIISLVAVVVSVGSLVFDQVRFNYEQSTRKSEESEKIEMLTKELQDQREVLRGSTQTTP